MTKYFLAVIVLFHGLIHLLGPVKAFGLAPLAQLTQAISRPLGLLWLLASFLFLLSAGLLLSGRDSWWMAALPAVLLSQTVIVLSWQDARFGTLANLIILLAAVPAWASWSFSKQVNQGLSAIMPASLPQAAVVQPEQLDALPPVVSKWLQRAGVVGKPEILTVQLQQQGRMRTSPEGAWMPVQAEQYFTTREPAFNWQARVSILPGIELLGWDQYAQGKGQMLIKALGLYTVAQARGLETDQSTMLRYLGEMAWFPSAALSPWLSWEGIDANSAKATMTYGGIKASAVFNFTPEGDLRSLEASRYYDRPTGATLETWRVETEPDAYRSFSGIRIPARSAVTWKLKEGDFTWFHVEIIALGYNGAPVQPAEAASAQVLTQVPAHSK